MLLQFQLAGLAVKRNAVQRVFVRFEADVLDDAGRPLRFLRGGVALRLTVFPFGRESDLLDARQQHSVKVFAHLDEDELALAAILAV